MSKCVRCHRVDTYDSPEDLCDLHWVLWATDGLEEDSDNETAYNERVKMLKEIWEKYGEPADDPESMLKELADIKEKADELL